MWENDAEDRGDGRLEGEKENDDEGGETHGEIRLRCFIRVQSFPSCHQSAVGFKKMKSKYKQIITKNLIKTKKLTRLTIISLIITN